MRIEAYCMQFAINSWSGDYPLEHSVILELFTWYSRIGEKRINHAGRLIRGKVKCSKKTEIQNNVS
jgi:hypothetical protein